MTTDGPALPVGVHAPDGVDETALAQCVELARRLPGEPTRAHLERLASVARLELGAQLTRGIHPTLQVVVELIDQLLVDTDGVSIILHDEEDRSFVTSASTIPGQVSGDSAGRVRSRGATRFIVDHGVGICVTDIAEDPFGANAMLTEAGMRSYVGLPVLANGECVAALYAMSPRPDAFDGEDIELLRVVADRAAMVIASAREHQRVIRIARHSQASALATRQMAAAMGTDASIEPVLAQLALSVDFDLLVLEVSSDAALARPGVVVGASEDLRTDWEEVGAAAIEERFGPSGRFVRVGEGATGLPGVGLVAVRERSPLDAWDRETLRTAASVLALPFRREFRG